MLVNLTAVLLLFFYILFLFIPKNNYFAEILGDTFSTYLQSIFPAALAIVSNTKHF